MSGIDNLIAQLAPQGVRFERLGDAAHIASDRADAGQLDAKTYVGVDNLLPNFGGRRDSTYGANSSGAIRFQPGDVLIGNIRPYLKKVWLADRTGGASPDVITISILPKRRDEILPRFLYFVIASARFVEYSMKHAKGAKMPRGDKAATLNYRIPVPPLQVQREIVRILDNLTGLEAELGAELGAELEARRLQYVYFREMLLNAESVARREPIGKVLSLRAGQFIAASHISSERDEDHPYPCFGGNGIRGFVAEWTHDGAYALIGRQGALSGNVKRVDGKFYATEHALVASPIEKSEIGWLFHALVSMNLNQYVSNGAQPGLAVATLDKVPIAVPGLREQVRIGEILDKFQALVNDLSIGLPAELAARRKQYEYYRDKLITFDEAPA